MSPLLAADVTRGYATSIIREVRSEGIQEGERWERHAHDSSGAFGAVQSGNGAFVRNQGVSNLDFGA